jgi:hypothetical protein
MNSFAKISKSLAFLLIVFSLGQTAEAQKRKSLVPETPSLAFDYFNTWNVQGYKCSYSTSEAQRSAMNEVNIFGDSTFQSWIKIYPQIRKDLIFVMDDSWDIPQNENFSNNKFIGLVELDSSRFPTFKGDATERLAKLVKAVKAAGWKGAGGWISAQEASVNRESVETYWKKRMLAANKANFTYWKVDWGKRDHDEQWRKMLTLMARRYAPNLIIEHAMVERFIGFSDVYRTYDVENIIAQPVTIQRIANLLNYDSEQSAKSIINCEDEPYIAAGLGCAVGIMRHPFKGNLPNNTIDFVFPPVGRNIKLRIDEVVRAVRWHRLAAPFKVGSKNFFIDSTKLQDNWIVGFRDTYTSAKAGDTLRVTAPARVSRGLPGPVVGESSGIRPFVLSSLYPNGAIAIATIGRGLGREYITKRVDVIQKIPSLDKPIGIFGDYQSLTLILPKNISHKYRIFYAQDLAGNTPINISKKVILKGNKLILSGQTIREVGLSAKTKNDLSDPGLVLVCEKTR